MSVTQPCYARGATALLICLLAPAAEADVITARYNVTILEHCSATDCSSVDVTFPLTMMFDSRIIRDEVTPTQRTVQYGPPTFSAVPFERPPVLPGATESRFTLDIAHPPGETTSILWRRVSQADHSFQLVTTDFDYRWTLRLREVADTDARPELSAESFARFLSEGGDFPESIAFVFGYSGINRHNPGEFTPDSFSVAGFVALADDSAPIPEPASVTLFGFATATVLCQARRRRKRGA